MEKGILSSSAPPRPFRLPWNLSSYPLQSSLRKTAKERLCLRLPIYLTANGETRFYVLPQEGSRQTGRSKFGESRYELGSNTFQHLYCLWGERQRWTKRLPLLHKIEGKLWRGAGHTRHTEKVLNGHPYSVTERTDKCITRKRHNKNRQFNTRVIPWNFLSPFVFSRVVEDCRSIFFQVVLCQLNMCTNVRY